MKRAVIIAVSLVVVVTAFLAGSWYNQRASLKTSAMGARKILHYVDPMHPAYTSDKPGIAPDCGMELVPVYDDGSTGGAEGGAASRLPGTVNISAERQHLVGLKVQLVEKRSVARSLRALGRVAVDDRRVYLINSAAAGWVREISSVTVGSIVQKGQKLATFYSPEFLSSQQAYFYALNALDRFMNQDPPNADQIKLTRANIQQYGDSLRSLGMGESQIEAIGRTRTLTDQIEMTSPTSGIVIARNLYPGQRFDRATEFYKIADLSHVWILVDIYENEAGYFKPGARVPVHSSNLNRTYQATVSDAPPIFESASRTLKLRLEVDNPGQVLRPDMFVHLELLVELPSAITVPVDAVVDSGIQRTVYVDKGNGIFEPRKVETGWRHGDRVEIVKGLTPGERIVVSGTFLIDSESRMRAAAAGISGETDKDPVCGMEVDVGKAKAAGRHSVYNGNIYVFCIEECKHRFDKDPRRYVGEATDKEAVRRPKDLQGVEWQGATVTAPETWGGSRREMGTASGAVGRGDQLHD
ncbi:MAG TPA: efflux RND transporter periplasmic adaptor subunit [Candidatus Methylomirabilis sp.]|nr:efflux RND transporter periplasmic adaptor subunit [Candidatus Methylomirabilis sp.]